MPDIFAPAKRRQIMQSVRRTGTAIEELAARAFEEAGVPFERNVDSLPGKPDFYFPSAGLVVFVHGCFWHGHEACRKGTRRPKTRRAYWRKKIERNKRRDRRVTCELRHMGLSVYTVWGCELRRSGLPARVVRRLRERPASRPRRT